MARILGVGIATLDIINHVPSYPAEDAEVRALSQQLCRGGNATNTLVVLSQFGHDCRWAGTLADDANSAIIRTDLAANRIDMAATQLVAGGHAPTSYISLSQQNGSRTIVHYRDLPEYTFAHFQGLELAELDWLHFEGRNVEQTLRMLEHARKYWPQLPISVEIEKPRDGIERLCRLADLLLYSGHYARHHGYRTAEPFLADMQRQAPQAIHVCTWGTAGAYAVDGMGSFLHSPAFPPAQVIDTIGAGDTFNAGFIHARLAGLEPSASLERACRVAGRKCGQRGFQGLADEETR